MQVYNLRGCHRQHNEEVAIKAAFEDTRVQLPHVETSVPMGAESGCPRWVSFSHFIAHQHRRRSLCVWWIAWFARTALAPTTWSCVCSSVCLSSQEHGPPANHRRAPGHVAPTSESKARWFATSVGFAFLVCETWVMSPTGRGNEIERSH